MIVNDKSSERVPNVENLIAVASLSPCFTDDLLGLQYDNGISVDTSMPQEKADQRGKKKQEESL